MTTTPAPGADLSRLRLGTAPDSWGVWFPDDPHQVPWHQFLDEAAAAGYTLVELGPFGYLPTLWVPVTLRTSCDLLILVEQGRPSRSRRRMPVASLLMRWVSGRSGAA